MRRSKCLLVLMALFAVLFTAQAQNQKKYEVYSVGFYNLENLFDTIHDAGRNS